jgi:predicted DNA-binding ribbon-helix-helix protein
VLKALIAIDERGKRDENFAKFLRVIAVEISMKLGDTQDCARTTAQHKLSDLKLNINSSPLECFLGLYSETFYI